MVRIVLSFACACVVVAGSAEASCVTDMQGPCYRFWKVDAVFVAKVLEKVSLPVSGLEASPGMILIGGDARLQVRVVEAFRGVKYNAVITLFAPDGVCGSVRARDGGELFIYASRNKEGELWAEGCGVSRPLEDAEADLAYARSVTGVGPPALIYGDVHLREDRYGDYRDFSVMEGVRVRVSGKNFSAETLTDEEGNYSIVVPDTGPYVVRVIMPKGFTAWWDGSRQTVTLPDRRGCFNVLFQLKPPQ